MTGYATDSVTVNYFSPAPAFFFLSQVLEDRTWDSFSGIRDRIRAKIFTQIQLQAEPFRCGAKLSGASVKRCDH